LDVVADNLRRVAIKMVQRSTKGARVAPRYRIAMYAYSSSVQDVFGGVKTIEEVAQVGVPQLVPLETTDTAAAFLAAERLLLAEAPNLQNCPAPLICHLTDGEYNGADPQPIVDRIRQMEFPDGHVLVENIFVTDEALNDPITNPTSWAGLSDPTQLVSAYGRKMFDMSSPIPEAYLAIMREYGYNQLTTDSRMMFPGNNPEIVELGFVMSSATPVTA